MGQRRNQNGNENENTSRQKKIKNNKTKIMGYSKNTTKREVHSNKHLHYKEERYQINSPNLCVKELKNEEQSQPKVRREENNRTEIKEIENKGGNHQSKSWFFFKDKQNWQTISYAKKKEYSNI